MNPWIQHVKQFASKHNISYRDALRNPKCKSTYKMVGGKNINIDKSIKSHTISAERQQEITMQENMVLGITMIMDQVGCSEESALDILGNEYFQEQVHNESGVIPTNAYHCAHILVYLTKRKQDKLIKLAKMIYLEEESEDEEQTKMHQEDIHRRKYDEEIEDMMRQFGF